MQAMRETKSKAAETLSKVPVFSALTDPELTMLARSAVPRSYAAGTLVFTEGEPCVGLYVVQSGQIRIFKSSASGREQVLGIEGPGSSVAELPVFRRWQLPGLGVGRRRRDASVHQQARLPDDLPGASTGGPQGIADRRSEIAAIGWHY